MYTDSQSISSSADKTDESGFCPEMGTVGKKKNINWIDTDDRWTQKNIN